MLYITIIIILYLSQGNYCLSQNFSSSEQKQIDSLNFLINSKLTHDTAKANAYLVLSEILTVETLDTMIPLCNEAQKIAKKGLENKPSESVKNSFLTSLAGAYNNIGFAHKNKGEIVLALEYFHKSLKIYEKVNDKKGVVDCSINIGSIYDRQGNYEKALDFYNSSLEICKEIGYHNGEAACLNNMGGVYSSIGNLHLALEFYLKSLKVAESLGNNDKLAIALNNIGTQYKSQGNYEKALEYYLKSLNILKESGNKQGIAYLLNNLAGIEFAKNNFVSAEKYSKQSLDIAKEIGYPENIQNAARVLSRAYEKQGKGKEALEMYKLFISMRDSLYSEANQKAAVQQEAKYEYEKQKAVDDAIHDKQIAIEQEAKAKQKIITYATAGGLALVVVFLIFVFNRLQITKKQKIVIETQKVEVEKQKEVVELAHSELEEKNQEILDSITYAKRIQNAILPSLKVVKEYLTQSFIFYQPKDIVAGDFYWLEQKENKVLFAAADCTGHGVPGAMVSVVCNNGLNRSVREFGLTDPGEILNKTREIVIAEFEKSEDEVKDGMDIALCSLEGKTLKYAGANNPLWIIRKGEIIETKANKQPIGQFDNPEPYSTHTIELQKEDSIYIFSDGFVDQFGGEKGKKFKAQSFRELLLSIQNKEMDEQQQIISKAFQKWKGSLEQIDDVCVIGVRI